MAIGRFARAWRTNDGLPEAWPGRGGHVCALYLKVCVCVCVSVDVGGREGGVCVSVDVGGREGG